MRTGQRPLYARRWLSLRIRLENRIARRFRRWSDRLYRDTRHLTEDAVVAFRKANGTWPESDHPYAGMRG